MGPYRPGHIRLHDDLCLQLRQRRVPGLPAQFVVRRAHHVRVCVGVRAGLLRLADLHVLEVILALWWRRCRASSVVHSS